MKSNDSCLGACDISSNTAAATVTTSAIKLDMRVYDYYFIQLSFVCLPEFS